MPEHTPAPVEQLEGNAESTPVPQAPAHCTVGQHRASLPSFLSTNACRPDLARIRSIASSVLVPDLMGAELAQSLGPATKSYEGTWTVKTPNVAGVAFLLVWAGPAYGPVGYPNEVAFVFTREVNLLLHEVTAAFEPFYGGGTVVTPTDWEPWRITYKGPSNDQAAVQLIVSTDGVTGKEPDPRVTEITVRRVPSR
jgi:hypothetical protein